MHHFGALDLRFTSNYYKFSKTLTILHVIVLLLAMFSVMLPYSVIMFFWLSLNNSSSSMTPPMGNTMVLS